MNETQQTPPPAQPQQFGCLQSLVIVFAALMALFVFGLAANGLNPPPAPPAPVQPQRLQGIALYKGRAVFRVCSRTDLHRCLVRWGFTNNGNRGTLASARIPLVRAVPSCETQVAHAVATCDGEAALLQADGAVATTAMDCMDSYGVISRETGRFSTLDVRDEQLQLSPGTMRIDCAEGYSTGSFDDTL